MNSKEVLLQMVRHGVETTTPGCTIDNRLPLNINWEEVEALATKQELSAVLLDGVGKIPEVNRPEKKLYLKWIGEVVQGYELHYDRYCKAVADLASFYNNHGYKMMVLKGMACGLDWPKPAHRSYGDIDIWLFGKQKEADALMVQEFKVQGFKVDNSHHHHSVFNWQGFIVENHYDFINVYDYKSSKDLEGWFKRLGQDDAYSIELNCEKVYIPSPNLHALFLLRHMVSHFASVSITLRQVLDWAFFMRKHGRAVDWDWMLPLLEEYHMKDFFNCINAICVDDLGFEQEEFPYIQFNPFLKDKILSDIMEPAFEMTSPKRLVPRLIYKYRRWQGNAWKQELCYKDSRCSSFFYGLKAHLLKPSSI